MAEPKLNRSYSLACSDFLNQEVIRKPKKHGKSEFGYYKNQKLLKFVPWFPKWVPVLMTYQSTIYQSEYYFLDKGLMNYFITIFDFDSSDTVALTNYFDYS